MAHTSVYVASGQVLSGQSFTNTDLFVELGGTIVDDSLGSNTLARVETGASATSIEVYSGGYLSGGAGSMLSDDTIYAGGVQTEGSEEYHEGPTTEAIDTLVLSGGVDDVEENGLSISAIVGAGGLQSVDFEALASSTLVERDGDLVVSFGSATHIAVERGGQLEVEYGASANGVVLAGGVAVVQPDVNETAMLSGLEIASGATLVLLAGATEQGAMIAAGATVERASVAVFGRDGDSQLLLAAGDTLAQNVGFGMSAYVYSGGVLSASTVADGGHAFVQQGGLAIDPVVGAGGVLSVAQYESAVQLVAAIDPVVLNGGTLLAAAANITGATIHSGGLAIISGLFSGTENGLADTTVLAGGLVSVDGYGLTDRTLLGSGAELLLDRGTTNSTLVQSGAAFVVLSGAVDDTIVQSGGQITVVGRGNDTFNGGRIEAGGTLTFVSGYAGHAFSNFVLGSGATLVEIAGGAEYGLTIEAGAHVISGNVGLFQDALPDGPYYRQPNVDRLLAVGNTLSAVTVAANEYLEDAFGGAVSGLTIEAHGSAALLGGTIEGGVIFGGDLTVVAGTATGLTILAGGDAFVDSGTVQDVTIGQGGNETTEYGTLANTIISMGGVQDVDLGGATDTSVLHGGVQYIGRGTALDTTIFAGGTVVVDQGVLQDAMIATGGTIDLEYATYVAGATASLDSRNDVLTIVEGGSSPRSYKLELAGNYGGETFHIAADKKGGTMITLSAAGAAISDPALAHELAPGGYPGGHTAIAMPDVQTRPAGSPGLAQPVVPNTALGHITPHVL